MKSDNLTVLQEKLAETVRKSEAEKEAGKNFVSAVAHELRTPVAVIRGSLEALCDGVVYEREQVSEYHRQMLSESIYLQRLVTDLLEYSRLQNAEFSIAAEPVMVHDVLTDVCRGIRRIADEKGVLLSVQENGPLFAVNGDYARLRQMFIVILDNAVKFTEPGGSVSVTEKEADGKLYVTVSDTGCGIPENEISDIFVRFHRSHSDMNRSGTGLGLAIAKEIASRHSAEIKVSSVPGEGTSFTFVFSGRITPEETAQHFISGTQA